MIWFRSKLKYFNSDHTAFLHGTVTKDAYSELPETVQKNLKFLFSRIDEHTSQGSLKAIVDCVSQTMIYGDDFVVSRVNKGENLRILIQKADENDTYVPFALVAREHETNKILAQKTAEEVFTQYLNIDNLDLEPSQIYKIRVQLEIQSGGETTGDAVAQLFTMFFIVLNDIDE